MRSVVNQSSIGNIVLFNSNLLYTLRKVVEEKIYFWETRGLYGEYVEIFNDMRLILMDMEDQYESMKPAISAKFIKKRAVARYDEKVKVLNLKLRAATERLKVIQDLVRS